jgi:hypothetical protein
LTLSSPRTGHPRSFSPQDQRLPFDARIIPYAFAREMAGVTEPTGNLSRLPGTFVSDWPKRRVVDTPIMAVVLIARKITAS